MQNIQIKIRNRIAAAKYGERIVSDNAGYTITFDFDEEWNDTDRTARFIFDSGYIDVPFSGDTVFVPMLPASVQEVKVGVYSGSLQTTTAATITVVPSCLGSDDTEYIPATDIGIPDAADLAEEDTLRIYDKSAGKLVKATIKKLGEAFGGEGGGGTTDHSKLENRDEADQHPISAITGLEEALTPLTGTTETLTPTQVYDAIKSGKSVVLQHSTSFLGLFTFASFNIFEEEKTVVSNSIAKTGGTYLVGSLVGLAGSNEWVFNITEMAETDDIPVAVDNALAQAKASGEFDGADGKSAYSYAQDGGYIGTEAEFAKKLASEAMIVSITENNGTLSADKTYADIVLAIHAGTTVLVSYGGMILPLIIISNSLGFGTFVCGNNDTDTMVATAIIEITETNEVNDISADVHIPKTLPNPNALTFTGAVTGSYDGSAPLTVEILSGGGSGFDKWECINTFTIPADTAEDVTSITFSEDAEGKPFALKKFYAVFAGITGGYTYFCIRINDLPINQQFGTDIITGNNLGERNPLILYFEIAGSGFYHWSCPNVKSFGYRADGERISNGGTQSNISQINKISFNWGTGAAITPGTTVKLWGVRT